MDFKNHLAGLVVKKYQTRNMFQHFFDMKTKTFAPSPKYTLCLSSI